MSTCPKCTASIAPDARFCTDCGTSIPACPVPPPCDTNPCGDEIHTALAAANLCKLRGEWQAAIDKCMLVLGLDEDNAAAHSLLGDVYRDQGRLGEAMHWYKLALDLNPDSTADKSKLDQLSAQGQMRRPAGSNRQTELIMTAKRVVAEAALAIGLLLIITTVWPIISRPKLGTSDTPQLAQHPQTVRLPSTIPDDSSPAQSPRAKPGGSTMASREDTLLQSLNSSPTLAHHRLHIKSILLDPRNRSAVVTCVCAGPGKEAAAQALVRGSVIVLREVCFKDNELERLTVRALYVNADGGSTDARFVADANRNAVLSINPESAEHSQLINVLQNPWWAPGLK